MSRKRSIGLGILILCIINILIYQKEQHLSNGEVVLLELAPVDPRSLMQGDYMRLRFALADTIRDTLTEEMSSVPSSFDGFVVVSRDRDQVGSFVRLSQTYVHNQEELSLHYRIRKGTLAFATNAFFFQEGDAEIYERAKYGQFRVDDHGELLLTNMYDEARQRLGND